MKRALLFAFACLAAALPALAAEGTLDFTIAVDPAALLAAAPPALADEDGLVVYEAHHYRYADGLMRHRHQRLLRVTTEWALERLADPRLRFDSARQQITVHAARTYFPGGGAVDSPANAFNSVTPGELALAPDFLDIQELVITHVGLEPGCALWLDTEIVDTAPAGLPEGALLFPQGEFPVLEMDVTAEGLYGRFIDPANPAGLILETPKSEWLGYEEAHEKDQLGRRMDRGGELVEWKSEANGKQREWRFRDLPAAPGQATHRLGDQLPHMILSPLSSWESVMEAVEASLTAAAADTAGLGAWLASVEQDLERPFLSDRDALNGIAAALGERTNLLQGADWAWRAPRSVARILGTSIATPLERTAVLVAVCQRRDYDAKLEVPSRWQMRSQRLLALAALDDPLLRFPYIGHLSPAKGRILDPNELQEVFIYTPERPDPKRLRVYGPSVLMAESSLYWNLSTGNFTMDLRLASGGHWEGADTPESALREWCEGWTDSSRVEKLDLNVISTRLRAGLNGVAMPPAADAAGRTRLALPILPVDLAALLPPGMQRAQSECRAALFPRPTRLHLRWVLELPADTEALVAPPVSASCPTGSLSISSAQEGRRLTLSYDLDWATEGAPTGAFIEPIEPPAASDGAASDSSPGSRVVAPADYPAFRELVNAALDLKATEVLLIPSARD